MTVNNIFTTRFARNLLISRVLTEMELVRELNEGVPRIFEEMKAAGLPEPKIVETTANVTVVLYNGKTAANNAQTTESTTQKTTENATEKTTEKIIRILKERPYATAGQLAEELGLTVDGVDYNIRKLKKQCRSGILRFAPAGENARKEKCPPKNWGTIGGQNENTENVKYLFTIN